VRLGQADGEYWQAGERVRSIYLIRVDAVRFHYQIHSGDVRVVNSPRTGGSRAAFCDGNAHGSQQRKALRFTLSEDITAAIPPGDERLFRIALAAARL
jgi:hypothetical protein